MVNVTGSTIQPIPPCGKDIALALRLAKSLHTNQEWDGICAWKLNYMYKMEKSMALQDVMNPPKDILS
jgi:hypothetical protein